MTLSTSTWMRLNLSPAPPPRDLEALKRAFHSLQRLQARLRRLLHAAFGTERLVETGPGARLREAREEAAHDLIVQAVRAVEDHHGHRERLAQVLRGLRLARARRPRRRTTVVQVHRAGERHVALVRERRHHLGEPEVVKMVLRLIVTTVFIANKSSLGNKSSLYAAKLLINLHYGGFRVRLSRDLRR